jgi:carboxymethylenebutenolidase
MIEKKVDIQTPDGVSDALFFAPGEDGQWPGVIIYPDIGGIRPCYEEMARDFAKEGFCALVINIYYRGKRTPVFDPPFKFGDDASRATAQEYAKKNTAEALEKDTGAYVDFLLAQKQVKGPKVCVVGFCMTGSWAIRTAAARPDKVAAASSFHGGRLATDAPESPHLLAPKIKGKMLFGFAVEDGSMPLEAIAKLEAALKQAGVSYEAETYDGAKHGWMMKDHPAYHPDQEVRGWRKMVSFFKDATR